VSGPFRIFPALALVLLLQGPALLVQDQVATRQDEPETPGFGIAHLRLVHKLRNGDLRLEAGISWTFRATRLNPLHPAATRVKFQS
jgi:hypothetical protein